MLLKNKEYNIRISDALGIRKIQHRIAESFASITFCENSAVKSIKIICVVSLNRDRWIEMNVWKTIYSANINTVLFDFLTSHSFIIRSRRFRSMNSLTSDHFLIGDVLTTISENNLREVKMNRLGLS